MVTEVKRHQRLFVLWWETSSKRFDWVMLSIQTWSRFQIQGEVTSRSCMKGMRRGGKTILAPVATVSNRLLKLPIARTESWEYSIPALRQKGNPTFYWDFLCKLDSDQMCFFLLLLLLWFVNVIKLKRAKLKQKVSARNFFLSL